MSKFTDPVVLIRPALPRDKADVFEFTKFIWDGHDYVGHVFPEWLEDPEGQLFAAEYAGHCVGTGKVTLVAPGQWWLEGFRVDPKVQGMKIGSAIDARCNEWWDEHGQGTLRLLTNSRRVKVHHLSEARGFVKVGEMIAYVADALPGPADSFTPLTPPEAGEAVAFCRRTAPDMFMNLGWRILRPDEDAIRDGMENGFQFFWWRGRSGFVSAWDDDEGEDTRLTVGMEACAPALRADLLTDLRRLASARASVSARWMNCVDESTLRILDVAGYHRDWDDEGFLYERSHP